MGMNRTKIEWTDYTWNPVTGCKNNCSYCYAQKISHRFGRSFEPTLHPKRLEEPYKLKKPSKIFVCSMGELFGSWVPKEWQEEVLKVTLGCPQHIFQLLTKFPNGYAEYGRWPSNIWLGTTVTGVSDVHNARILRDEIADASVKFVSLEPWLEFVGSDWFQGLDWVIVGAQTNPIRQPGEAWIKGLLDNAEYYGYAVFMKDNLGYEPKRREWPKGV